MTGSTSFVSMTVQLSSTEFSIVCPLSESSALCGCAWAGGSWGRVGSDHSADGRWGSFVCSHHRFQVCERRRSLRLEPHPVEGHATHPTEHQQEKPRPDTQDFPASSC